MEYSTLNFCTKIILNFGISLIMPTTEKVIKISDVGIEPPKHVSLNTDAPVYFSKMRLTPLPLNFRKEALFQ